ncbi:hypothetical protein [Moorena producens]|uniref:hypothetical protein n=1 Tax=Moorena producens TaxID=1155739 RepID=UPI0013146DC8|nr:hypothetical protein [Moorena producens]
MSDCIKTRLHSPYGNYRQRRRLAVGHAKGEREQTMGLARTGIYSLTARKF